MTPRRVGVGVLLALFLIGAAILGVLGSQVRSELSVLRSASADNIEWNLSQLEVDILNFQLALEAMHHRSGPLALQQVRQKFDIFYSRIDTVHNGSTFAIIRENSEMVEPFAEISAFLEREIPLIDGPDDVLLARAGDVAEEAAALRPTLRKLAIHGVSAFALESTHQREHLSILLSRTSVMSIGMIVVLGAVLAVLFRQFAISEQESQRRKQSNMRLKAVIRSSLDAIVVVNSKGLVIDYNGAASDIFGYSHDEVIGRSVGELIIPERYRRFHLTGLRLFKKTGKKTILDAGLIEHQALHKDGHEFPVELSVASADGPNGTIFVSFIRDITDRLRVQQELTVARDDALAADKAKSNFLAVMSHEMRTPLNGIMGTLELLANTRLGKKQKNYVRIAQSSGAFLMHHINDVLDISKVQAGKLELAEDVFSPVVLAQDVIETNKANARAQGNVIRVCSVLSLDVGMVADRLRVSQTLLNLVGNAIKFTSGGAVEVVVSLVASAGGPMIEFRVNDTGIGISEENLSEVFEDFVTIDTSYSRRSSGTGLGLGISQRMAEAMGGCIGVESELGSGSSFWFRIPLVEGEILPATVDPNPDVPGIAALASPLSILMVEDNVINRFVAREMLEGLGHSVTEAVNGEEAVTMASQTQFDIILMDISMPVLDGVDATVQIRASNAKSKNTPIIGLTAHALPEELARFSAIGMQECILKPASIAVVSEVLACYAPASASRSHDAPHFEDYEADTDAMIEVDIFADLIELLGEEQFRAAFDEFASEVEHVLSGLPKPAELPDLANIQPEIHKLAGATALFGAKALQELLAEVETGCKRADVASVNAQILNLKKLWKVTRAELVSLLE